MKQTTIDESLLPDVFLTWNAKSSVSGTFYLDCKTGEKTTRVRGDKYVTYKFIKSGSKPRYAYAKYHEDIDCLELAEVTIDTTRKVEIHPWKYAGTKYFLRKDKTVLDEHGCVRTANFYLSPGRMCFNFNEFLSLYQKLHCTNRAAAINEFKRFLGASHYTIGNGRVCGICGLYNIYHWYTSTIKTRASSKRQKLIDQLINMPVKNLSDIGNRFPVQRHVTEQWMVLRNIIYFERLINGWSVLRLFYRDKDNDTPEECERIYIHNDGGFQFVCFNGNDWVPSSLNNQHCGYFTFPNMNEAIESCARLKYILPLCTNHFNIRKFILVALYFPDIDWYFKDVSDAVRAHDTLLAIIDYSRREKDRIANLSFNEALKETDKKRRKYEYEDERFIIRLPTDCDEISAEGEKQKICIGGYVSRHARGDTTLLFLRKKSDPNTPFYAIELSNANRISQIHGFGNRWLGNNPEAIPTVVRWLREHNIVCNEEILTCCSIGYARTQSFIKMPVVD